MCMKYGRINCAAVINGHENVKQAQSRVRRRRSNERPEQKYSCECENKNVAIFSNFHLKQWHIAKICFNSFTHMYRENCPIASDRFNTWSIQGFQQLWIAESLFLFPKLEITVMTINHWAPKGTIEIVLLKQSLWPLFSANHYFLEKFRSSATLLWLSKGCVREMLQCLFVYLFVCLNWVDE